MKQKTIKTVELVNFLQHLVNEKKLLISNQSIVLAVSGGQDSICLFFIFLQLKTQWSWDFSLLYCNHLWQKDSFYTMSHLFKLAYLLNVRLFLTITLQKISTEQKARNWRFLTFQRITQFYLLNGIVTGHSKSDRIETGLFNIFRGSGTKGVTSLDWTKVINKRCFFKCSQTQLKNLKNLYQIEKNIDVLYPWKKRKKQFCPSTKLLFYLFFLTSLPLQSKKGLLLSSNMKICYAFLAKQGSQRFVTDLLQIWCPFEGSEKKERFVSMKCQSVRSFKFVKVKQKELEIFPLYTTEYTLVRPFLSLPRFDLKKLCTSWKIPLFPDQSNQKVKYQRNRIRKQLLPTLRFFFNPQIDTVLYQFIDIIKKEEEYINFITARIVRKFEQKQEKSVELETSLFGVLPIAVKRKVIQHFLDPIMKKSLTFFDIEKVLKQLSIANIAYSGKQIPFKNVLYQDAKSQKSFLKKQEKHPKVCKVNKKILKPFLLSASNLFLTSFHKSKFCNMKVTLLTSRDNVKKEMLRSKRTGFAKNLPTERLFIKGKLTEKHILRICFVSPLTSHTAKFVTNLCCGAKNIPQGCEAQQVCNKLLLKHPTGMLGTTTLPPLTSKMSEGAVKAAKQGQELLRQRNKVKICKPEFSFNIERSPYHLVTSPMVMSQGDVSSILQKDILFTLINKKKSIYKEYELMFFPKTGSLFLHKQRLFFIKNKQNF